LARWIDACGRHYRATVRLSHKNQSGLTTIYLHRYFSIAGDS
jgi:hypothetical protein